MYLVEKFSNKIGVEISSKLNLDKDKEEIIIYGALNLFQIILSIFWVIVFGIIFKVLLEAIIVFFTISVLRKYSGGVHSNSPIGCIIIGTTISVGLSIFIKNLLCSANINLIIVLILLSFTYSYYNVFKYAPVDSDAKPIKKIETRNRLKNLSILIINILITVILILLYVFFRYKINIVLNISNCICLGIMWQSFTLTPLGKKVLIKLDKKLIN